jgi:hypothetical protein
MPLLLPGPPNVPVARAWPVVAGLSIFRVGSRRTVPE